MSAAGWWLAVTMREPDQAVRLTRFGDAHPEVEIGRSPFNTVRARIPDENGGKYDGREIFGRSLRELLDKLCEVFSPDSG